MKRIVFVFNFLFASYILFSQTQTSPAISAPQFFEVKTLKATPVKNQAMTGTCWCIATKSLVESEDIRRDKQDIDISEMYTVRYMYIENSETYILRGGTA